MARGTSPIGLEQAMPRQLTPTDVTRVRDRLQRRAWAFDDPRSYRAGVDEAIEALQQSATTSSAEDDTPTRRDWRTTA